MGTTPGLGQPRALQPRDCRWFITGGVSAHVSEPTLFNFPTNREEVEG